MQNKTIQIFNLDKTLKLHEYPIYSEIVSHLITNQIGVREKDFHRLKTLFEAKSYRTFKKVNELVTKREGKIYQILETQELSVKVINEKYSKASNECHFYGEMDLNLTWTKAKLYKKAFNIACHCGYMVTRTKDSLILYGCWEDHKFILKFNSRNKLKEIIDQTDNKNVSYLDLNKLPEGVGYKQGYFY